MARRVNKKTRRERDAPAVQSGVIGVSGGDMWQLLAGEGYVPLYECPEVRMCIAAYADLISSMTLHLMRNTERGDVREVNELSRRLDIEPNRYMSRKALMWHIVNVLLGEGDGNCVVVPKFSREGYLDELIPAPPSAVYFTDAPDGYRVHVGATEYRPDEVLHFTINPDPERPWIGRGMRLSLRETVQSIRQANKTKNALLASPAPSLIIRVDALSEEFASAEGRRKIADRYISDSESGRPWMIPAEVFDVSQVKPLTMGDLAIRDNLELDRRTIAGVTGVPPFIVGVGNFNSDEYANFVTTRVMGVAQYIQQELTKKLLYSEGLYWRFNPRSLYNYKLADLITAGAQMVDRMAMRRNEWRDWVGLPPDAEMDDLLALENYIPADRLGDQKKLGGGEDT